MFINRLFINRLPELSYLEEKYDSGKAELIIVYGRRRLGKTTLIRRFLKGREGAYLIVSRLDAKVLDDFSRMLSDQLGMNYRPLFGEYRDFYKFLSILSARKRFALAIDEFQRIAESDPSFLMQLQEAWDSYLVKTKLMLILVGSAVGVIERVGLSSASPLYGRRTGQIRLKPMPFPCASLFFKGYSAEDKVRGYSVFGGVPAYLSMIDPSKSLMQNISHLILDCRGPLYEEPYHLLSEETREPLRYMAILEAMSWGGTTLGEISGRSGVPSSNLPKYIKILERELDIVERQAPLLEEKIRGKHRYYLKDHYLRFWFKYVKPNIHLLEMDEAERIAVKVRREIDAHASAAFEEIAREHFTRTVNATRIGRWWRRDVEIDCIAIDEKTGTAYFMEAKWTSKPVDRGELNNLIKKSDEFPWKRNSRREVYILYSRRGFTFQQEKDIRLYTLNQILEELKCKNPKKYHLIGLRQK